MRVEVHWIKVSPYRLGIMARPRGGEWLGDEIASLRAQGVDVLVSLLACGETAELGLDEEAGLCEKAGIAAVSFPIPDRGVPSDHGQFTALAERLAGELRAGRSVVIHCRAGIGRSSLLAATVMVRLGAPLADAMQQIATARGCAVPDTEEQRLWLEEHSQRHEIALAEAKKIELIIFIGLQGSGKTTFYNARFASTHALVSKDRFRNNSNRERRQKQLLQEALSAGRSVVVDNTNPTKADRTPLVALGREYGARIAAYYFESSFARCSERNGHRLGKARVPEVALRATVSIMERPSADEGFDERRYVRCLENGEFEVLDWQD